MSDEYNDVDLRVPLPKSDVTRLDTMHPLAVACRLWKENDRLSGQVATLTAQRDAARAVLREIACELATDEPVGTLSRLDWWRSRYRRLQGRAADFIATQEPKA